MTRLKVLILSLVAVLFLSLSPGFAGPDTNALSDLGGPRLQSHTLIASDIGVCTSRCSRAYDGHQQDVYFACQHEILGLLDTRGDTYGYCSEVQWRGIMRKWMNEAKTCEQSCHPRDSLRWLQMEGQRIAEICRHRIEGLPWRDCRDSMADQPWEQYNGYPGTQQ